MILSAVPFVEAHLMLALLNRLAQTLVSGDRDGGLRSAKIVKISIASKVPQFGGTALDDRRWRARRGAASQRILLFQLMSPQRMIASETDKGLYISVDEG